MALTPAHLVAMAFLVVVAITLTILSCTVVPNSDATALVPLLFYIFTPLPLLICGSRRPGDAELLMPGDSGFGGAAALATAGEWLVGVFGATGPCTAVVLWHVGRITWVGLLLSLLTLGCLVAAGAIAARATARQADDEAGLAIS